MVQASVIQAGNQMRCAGPRSGNAHAELARKFGVGRRHERRHLFVPRLNELDGAVGALQRAKHPIDTITRIAKDLSDTPRMKSMNKKIANGLQHD